MSNPQNPQNPQTVEASSRQCLRCDANTPNRWLCDQCADKNFSPSTTEAAKPDLSQSPAQTDKGETLDDVSVLSAEKFRGIDLPESVRKTGAATIRDLYQLEGRTLRGALAGFFAGYRYAQSLAPADKPTQSQGGEGQKPAEWQDIVERLRGYTGSAYAELAADEAADTIARLRQERDVARDDHHRNLKRVLEQANTIDALRTSITAKEQENQTLREQIKELERDLSTATNFIHGHKSAPAS